MKRSEKCIGARRQGDVLLIPIERFPEGANKKMDGIVAYGEITGHCHQFLDMNAATVFTVGSEQYVDIVEPTILNHEEHAPQTIPKGKYQVLIKQELDLVNAIHQVRD
jgi:hypothetical protein